MTQAKQESMSVCACHKCQQFHPYVLIFSIWKTFPGSVLLANASDMDEDKDHNK